MKNNETDDLIDYPAVISVEKGNGRLIWFGFQLTQLSSNQEEFESEPIFNAIDWLADKPPFSDDESMSDMMEECISAISLNNSWLTSYPRLIDWIEKREKLNVNLEHSDENDAVIKKLTNSGDQLVENVGLSQTISSSKKYQVQVSDDYQLRYDKNSGLYNILTPLTEPHEKLIVAIRYD